jgi:hypothetical protein
VEKLVPEDLHEFLMFLMTTRQTNSLNLTCGTTRLICFKPKSFKNYNLTPEEQKELDKFLDKNLEKGYI